MKHKEPTDNVTVVDIHDSGEFIASILPSVYEGSEWLIFFSASPGIGFTEIIQVSTFFLSLFPFIALTFSSIKKGNDASPATKLMILACCMTASKYVRGF